MKICLESVITQASAIFVTLSRSPQHRVELRQRERQYFPLLPPYNLLNEPSAK
jgi:hypothetical protein